MATMTMKKFSGTTENGNSFTVFETFTVESNGVFRGPSRCVRTWAECNGQQVEVETGVGFRACSTLEAAGF